MIFIHANDFSFLFQISLLIEASKILDLCGMYRDGRILEEESNQMEMDHLRRNRNDGFFEE